MTAALQADEFGDIFEILAENIFSPPGEHGHGLRAEICELLLPIGIVQNIHRQKVDALLRKKLFRSQATASTRLGVQYELRFDVFHGVLRRYESFKVQRLWTRRRNRFSSVESSLAIQQWQRAMALQAR
jgi:hypothetical protein